MDVDDRFVVVRSRGGAATLAALMIALLGAGESTAAACGVRSEGIIARSVWPGPERRPPINTRLVVTYTAFDVPGLGGDLVLLDESGATVPSSVTMLGTSAVLKPTSPLLPNHVYQVADRRTVSCAPENGGCDPGAQQVFASFTTSSGADDVAPTFGGLAALTVGERWSCSSSACCGPAVNYPVTLSWNAASDQTAAEDTRYNIYRRDGSSMTLVWAFWDQTTFTSGQTCSSAQPVTFDMAPGSYLVRAVDWSGNEDSNAQTLNLSNVCIPDVVGTTGLTSASDGAASGCTVEPTSGSHRDSSLLVLCLLLLASARSLRR